VIDLTWRIDHEEAEAPLTGAPRPLLGTWHYLRTSLRRRRLTWVGAAVLGALLGLGSVVLLAPSSRATTTLLMVHPANLDPSSAMATDLTLLDTRAVAATTIRELGLDVAPEDFQGSISAESVTNEILKITVAAPDDTQATTRADTLTRAYLAFRAGQLRSLSSGTIAGYQSRIDAMRKQVTELNRDYAAATAEGDAAVEEASAILTRRTQLNTQIVALQEQIEDAALNADAAIASTHVIDPAAIVSRSAKRAAVLNTVTGLIAGTALGVGFVLFRALTSTQLRRRQDVAVALRAPVRISVRSPGPWEGRRGVRWLLRRRPWRGRDLEALALGLGSAVLPRDGLPVEPADRWGEPVSEGVALAAIGNPRAGAAVVGALADHLRGLGRSVLLVDLSPRGSLVRWARRSSRGGDTEGSRSAHVVHRPAGVLGLARGPLADPGHAAARGDESLAVIWSEADVVLVLADVDPGVDAENLGSWVDQVVPLVTAGASTPELLQTTAELVRTAGLRVPFALMTGAHETDESLGVTDGSDEAATVRGPVGGTVGGPVGAPVGAP